MPMHGFAVWSFSNREPSGRGNTSRRCSLTSRMLPPTHARCTKLCVSLVRSKPTKTYATENPKETKAQGPRRVGDGLVLNTQNTNTPPPRVHPVQAAQEDLVLSQIPTPSPTHRCTLTTKARFKLNSKEDHLEQAQQG